MLKTNSSTLNLGVTILQSEDTRPVQRRVAPVVVQAVLVATFAFALPWCADLMLSYEDLVLYQLAIGIGWLNPSAWGWLQYGIPVASFICLALALLHEIDNLYNGEFLPVVLKRKIVHCVESIMYWIVSVLFALGVLLHAVAQFLYAYVAYEYGQPIQKLIAFGGEAENIAAILIAVAVCVAISVVLVVALYKTNKFKRLSHTVRTIGKYSVITWILFTASMIAAPFSVTGAFLLIYKVTTLVLGVAMALIAVVLIIALLPYILATAIKNA